MKNEVRACSFAYGGGAGALQNRRPLDGGYGSKAEMLIASR